MQANNTPPPQIVDPNLATEQAQAQKALVDNLQIQTAADTANLMARYGTTLALKGSGVSVPSAAPAPNPAVRF